MSATDLFVMFIDDMECLIIIKVDIDGFQLKVIFFD